MQHQQVDLLEPHALQGGVHRSQDVIPAEVVAERGIWRGFAGPSDAALGRDHQPLSEARGLPQRLAEDLLAATATVDVGEVDEALRLMKKAFADVDYELFTLLAGHAATAIFSSRLYSDSERKLSTIQGFLDLLTK